MLLTKYVNVKVTSNMCKYYKEKDYSFNCNDVISVDIKDLPPQSNYKVLVECENCKKQYYMPYYTYYKCGKEVYCSDCKTVKTKKTNLEKYGVENVFQNAEFQEKTTSNCFKKVWIYQCISK